MKNKKDEELELFLKDVKSLSTERGYLMGALDEIRELYFFLRKFSNEDENANELELNILTAFLKLRMEIWQQRSSMANADLQNEMLKYLNKLKK